MKHLCASSLRAWPRLGRLKFSSSAITHEPSVRASFNYCAGVASEVLVTNPFEGNGFQENEAAGAIETVEHTVLNGRLDPALIASSATSLEKRGMTLQQHSTSVSDFNNEADVHETYYPELLDISKRVVGAEHAVVVSHVLRQAAPERNAGEGAVRGGAYYVHNDFCDRLKGQFLQMYDDGKSNVLTTAPLLLSEERVRRGRLVMLNIWRPLNKEPLQRSPLAIADATSLDIADMHDYEHSPKQFPASYSLPTPIYLNLPSSNPDHRWFYFPGMTRDECLVFKTYDSDGRIPSNGVSVHSAFEFADGGSGPWRESIEARVLCFLDA